MRTGFTFGQITKGVDADGIFEAVASTSRIDRDVERLVSSGCDLAEYLRNPVIVAEHSASLESGHAPVIGKTLDIQATADAVPFRGQFAPTELGNERRVLYAGGFMNAFSVRAGYRKWHNETVMQTPVLVVDEWELMEISTVAVPANQDALRKAASKGIGGRTTWEALAQAMFLADAGERFLDEQLAPQAAALVEMSKRFGRAVAIKGDLMECKGWKDECDEIRSAIDAVSKAVEKGFQTMRERLDDVEAFVLAEQPERIAADLLDGDSANDPSSERRVVQELKALREALA